MIHLRRFRPVDLGLLAVLFALSLVATMGAWRDIAEQAFRDQEQTHILLALPVVVWLGVLRRRRLHGFRPKWSMAGPLAMLFGWALSLYGFRNGYDLFWHVGAIGIVVGSVVTVLGVRFVKTFLPSFAALVFLLPVPGRVRGPIAGWLQEVSARVAEFGLDLIAIPVTRGGNALNVNGTEVLIAEACNGMRMVSALALIAFAFVFSVPMRNSVRVLILALSPLVALIVNVTRLIPTSLMYGYAEHDAAALFHNISGWVVLGLALVILWGFLALLRWIEVPIAPYTVAEVGQQ